MVQIVSAYVFQSWFNLKGITPGSPFVVRNKTQRFFRILYLEDTIDIISVLVFYPHCICQQGKIQGLVKINIYFARFSGTRRFDSPRTGIRRYTITNSGIKVFLILLF